MRMSDIRIIRTTLTALTSMPDRFGAAFNRSLSASDPKLCAILSAQRTDDNQPLALTLALAIEGLSRPGARNSNLLALGQRRQSYGWQPRHDTLVGQALIVALADVLGDAFDEDARQAWTDGYVWLAETMLAATCNRMGLVA